MCLFLVIFRSENLFFALYDRQSDKANDILAYGHQVVIQNARVTRQEGQQMAFCV